MLYIIGIIRLRLQAPHSSKTPIQGVKSQGYPQEREDDQIKKSENAEKCILTCFLVHSQ